MRPEFLFVFCLLVGSVHCHNWMVSPSRVPLAATNFPCMGKRSIYPHVQVAVGQEFQMEWSSGHDRVVYFVLVRKSDESFLDRHSTKNDGNLEQYLGAAPSNLIDNTLTPMVCANCKYRRTSKAAGAAHTLGGTVASHYGPVMTTGAYYRARPAEFGPATSQYPYKASPSDRYARYDNTKYPWIKAVWRYEIQEADPNEWDFAVFKIPAGFGPGDYVIHYLWSGYYDCIDINVLNSTMITGNVPYPYGKTNGGQPSFSVNRVDHCLFDTPAFYVTIPRPMFSGREESAQSCVANCLQMNEVGGCSGVSTFPLSAITTNWGLHWNPANNILKRFYDTAWDVNGHFDDGLFEQKEQGIPRDYVGSGFPGIYAGIWRTWGMKNGQQQWISVNQNTLNTLRTYVESGTGEADPWVCVYVAPRSPTTTVDKYTIVDDPLDPVWYSTCYELQLELEFIGFNASKDKLRPSVGFAYTPSADAAGNPTSGCISCKDRAKWEEEAYTPIWKLAAKCVDCEAPNIDANWRSGWPARWALNTAASIAPAVASDTACTLPAGWTSWSDYCLIGLMWSHPLYGHLDADQSRWKWWGEGYVGEQTTYSTLTTRVGWSVHGAAENAALSIGHCQALAGRNAKCSALVQHQPGNVGMFPNQNSCRCVRQNNCCLKYLQVGSSAGNTLYEVEQPTGQQLDTTCTKATSKKSADGTKCCSLGWQGANACAPAGCTDNASGKTLAGGFCRGGDIPAERCCSKYQPPCRLC